MNAIVEDLEQRIQKLENQLADLKLNVPEDQLSMVVFSGDLDRMLAAFILATGAAAMYERVVMFFTFWGTAAMRDFNKNVKKADVMAKMFARMLPKGSSQLKLSQMNMAGLGTHMMKGLMKKKGVMSLEDLMKTAADFGVEIVICEMSMDLMGLKIEELIDYPNIKLAGAATFLQEAGSSKVSLFI
ncbi:MAG: DsrE/DsrF/DrsH-like family protein [Desulfobacterales bacterium]